MCIHPAKTWRVTSPHHIETAPERETHGERGFYRNLQQDVTITT